MPAMDYDRIAQWYDAYVRAEFDIPFFLKEAQNAHGPVLELTAGTGRVSVPLLRAGIDLTCVDSSADMLDVLRDKLRVEELTAEVVCADMCHLSLDKRFAMVFIPFHSVAELTDLAQQRQALQVIRTHLAPQGRFLCTLHNPPARLKCVTGQSRKLGDFSLRDGNTLTLSSVETYDATSGCVSGTQFYEVRRRNGMVVARMAVDLRFRLHSCCEFRSLAEAAGFVPVALYGDYSRASFEMETSPFMIWIFRKAETGAACEGQRAFE